MRRAAAESSLKSRHDPPATEGLRQFFKERFASPGDDLRLFVRRAAST